MKWHRRTELEPGSEIDDDQDTTIECDLSYLPKDPTPCPRCGDTTRTILVIYGFPGSALEIEDLHRVAFGGRVIPDMPMPDWFCPTCQIGFDDDGSIVAARLS